MNDKKFNLLSEAWIKVEMLKGGSKEVSLYDLFENAHNYLCLAGEIKHQDFSLLRLLEAILISVFYEDFENMIENPDDAYRIWSEIYSAGKFPFEKIRDYLEPYRDRFYLLHPVTPFGQVVNPIKENGKSEKVEKALVMGVSKLDGTYLESGNKLRYFRHDEPSELTYSESARWLLYMLNFDDNAVRAGKKPQGKKPAKMTGWLGSFTPVYLTGNNLFKTIMFNLILCDRNQQLWDEPNPIWKREPDESMSTWINIPNNLPELYTTFARRIWLEDSGFAIKRFTSYPGEIFEYEEVEHKRSYVNEKAEAHMVISKIKVSDKRKGKRVLNVPMKLKTGKALWTYYPSICAQQENSSMPLVVLWISRLNQSRLIDINEIVSLICLQTQYSDLTAGSVGELSTDEITFHSGILDSPDPVTESGESHGFRKGSQSNGQFLSKTNIVADEVKKLNELTYCAGQLTKNLNYLRESQKEDMSGSEKMMEILTEPFENWLFRFNPTSQDELRNCVHDWETTVRNLALNYLSEIERETEPELLRLKSLKVGQTRWETNSAQIMNDFHKKINHLYPSKKE